MSESTQYLRAGFVVFDARGQTQIREIPFRFNPENLARQLSVQQAGGGSGTDAGAADGGRNQNSDGKQGVVKESFKVTVRLDLDDLGVAMGDRSVSLGIAPEIAALEALVLPGSQRRANANATEPVTQRPGKAPTVLFVWGRRRVFPVRITGLNIQEQIFNKDLYPTRAEVEINLDVLQAEDAPGNSTVRTWAQQGLEDRADLAQTFDRSMAGHGSGLLGPWGRKA